MRIVTKRIEFHFTEKEMEFVNWLAKRDGKTFQQEIRMIMQLELDYQYDLYKDEMEKGL